MGFQQSVPIMISEKVMLREVNVSVDAPEWYKYSKDPEIHKWTGNQIPYNIKETRDILEKYKEINQIISWAIINNETGKIVGTYWVWKPIMKQEGYLIIPSEVERIGKIFWRKGYMKEARKLVYDYCFNILGVQEIHAQVWQDNINSIKSLEHAGHICYKKEEKMIEIYNSMHIECHFKLTKENWLKSKLMNLR